jgi:hypothetical protein
MVQKELRKLSQWFWKGFLKWYDGGGENGIISKRIFEIEMFFPSQIIDFPFYLNRLLEILFFLLLSSSFFLLRLLRTWGFDDIWGKNHFFKNFFSIGFNILLVDAYSGMEYVIAMWIIFGPGSNMYVIEEPS